ncbi:alpha/beta hydrolase [Thalassomonas haliotis]|uniref:Alpha/beta hydrolase n=1 Tax=Thalassomonas haliotis TaxID=485448 RepID=A0ABY7VA22_9GAMM|nr:alpha/beta hydrolase [Thalassomonas haliotis]WDE10181.1 alpha/beta hydrolase [Thalassomonas haliotis]
MRFSFFILLTTLVFSVFSRAENISLVDKARARQIPTELYYPDNQPLCSREKPCPVVLMSAGYGVGHNDYTFLAETFTRSGYLVVAIGHELPGDPALSVSGNLFETRSENWQRGAATLAFIQKTLKQMLPGYNFDALTLAGHSNGGDISAWLANGWLSKKELGYIKSIITLDHRRVMLPRTKDISVLSVRASDFAADKGVLPSPDEQNLFGSCVVTIANARHNDMSDSGPDWLKQKIQYIVSQYLNKTASCDKLQQV